MADAVDISGFRGIVPKNKGRNSGANFGRVARDVDLRRGCLESWRTPLPTAQFEDPTCRVYRTCDCCWIGSASACAKYVTATVCKTTVLSDACRYPRWTKDPCNDMDWCRLGLPKPEQPAIAGGTVIDNEFTEYRDYIITYCNDCLEGQPSVPSNSVKANKEDLVMIELPDAPPEWCITHINIYRLSTIAPVTTEQYLHPETNDNNLDVLLEQESDADYFLVATVPVGTQSFSDVGSMLCKDRRLLTTHEALPPPPGLCIVGETRFASLVGYVEGEQNVYFSSRNNIHEWPEKDQITVDYPIDHVCVCNNTAYVFTCAAVFLIEDIEEAKDDGCRYPREVKCPFPLCSKESVVKLEGGIMFASRTGYIRMASDGSYTNITGQFFSPRDWNLADPCSMRAAKHEGSLHFTSNKGSWILEMDMENTGMEIRNLTESSLYPTQYIEGDSGELFMLLDGTVYEWNAGDEFMEFEWESVMQNECDSRHITDARVILDDLERHKNMGNFLHFTFLNDNGEVYNRTIDHSRAFKICTNYSEETAVRVCGTTTVRRIKYAAGRRCLQQLEEGVS